METRRLIASASVSMPRFSERKDSKAVSEVLGVVLGGADKNNRILGNTNNTADATKSNIAVKTAQTTTSPCAAFSGVGGGRGSGAFELDESSCISYIKVLRPSNNA